MKVFLDTNVLIDIADDRENALLTETILNLDQGLYGVLHTADDDGERFPVELLPEQLT